MTALRSALFTVWMYGSMAVLATALSPALLIGHRASMGVIKLWARQTLGALRLLCGTEVRCTGLIPGPGPALIAAKHQGMLDVVAPFTVLDDPCFVLKKELASLPFFGWYARRTGMIVVDREAHAAALKKLITDARRAAAEGRQVLIFPEGTRTPVGQPGDYKPGVAALYRDLGLPCTPQATNSGACWPAHGFIRRPGVVIYDYLPPIPAGLKRDPFMQALEQAVETRSAALLTD